MTTTECEDNGNNNCAGRTAVNDGLASASAFAAASASAAAPTANNMKKRDTTSNKGRKKRRTLSPVFAYVTKNRKEHLVTIIDKRVLPMLQDGKNSQSENAGWGLDRLDQDFKIQIQWNNTGAKQPVVVSSVKLVPVSAPPTGPTLKKRKKSVHGTKIIKQARRDPIRGWIVEYKDGDKEVTELSSTYEANVEAARLVAEEEQRKQEVAAAEAEADWVEAEPAKLASLQLAKKQEEVPATTVVVLPASTLLIHTENATTTRTVAASVSLLSPPPLAVLTTDSPRRIMNGSGTPDTTRTAVLQVAPVASISDPLVQPRLSAKASATINESFRFQGNDKTRFNNIFNAIIEDIHKKNNGMNSETFTGIAAKMNCDIQKVMYHFYNSGREHEIKKGYL